MFAARALGRRWILARSCCTRPGDDGDVGEARTRAQDTEPVRGTLTPRSRVLLRDLLESFIDRARGHLGLGAD